MAMVFSAIASAFSAAAPAVGGTIGSAASSLFSTSGLMTVLQGGAGLVSAMAAMREGQAKAGQLELQAVDAEGKAGQAEVDGLRKQNSLRRALLQQMGDHDVAYAASGVDTSFGTAATARREAQSDAASALVQENSNTSAQKMALNRQAIAYRRAAKDSRRAGRMAAIGGLIGTGTDILARG